MLAGSRAPLVANLRSGPHRDVTMDVFFSLEPWRFFSHKMVGPGLVNHGQSMGKNMGKW